MLTRVPELEKLSELAHALGVSTQYYSQSGELVQVNPDVVADVVRALGADPTDEETIARSMEELRLRDWRRTLPPVYVTISGEWRTIWAHVAHGAQVRLDVLLEDGSVRELAQAENLVDPREIDGTLIGEASFVIPGDLPLGWHTVRAHLTDRIEESPLVVTPARLDPPGLAGRDRMWGFMTQLYSLRSRRSWGIGDLSDLTDLATWSAQDLGADFVLVNPLHAPTPVSPMAPSPYLPSSRRFANPIYLRIEEICEFGYLKPGQIKSIRRLAKPILGASDGLLDRDRTWAAKRAALDIVRTVPLTPGRQASYDAFVAQQGNGLIDACTWAAIAERHGAQWREWPEGLQHPRSSEVARWRSRNADDVERHLWMQWLLDEQLEHSQAAAAGVGMPIGIVHDLAVGTTFDGADAWALQDVLAQGVSVGAPPDMYNQMGQDWAQPPWRPDALANAAFMPYRDMLRTLLRHAGGLRIDHVLGLFRMWWVPRGRPANQGTYVAFDHEALIGILALEAYRAGAVIIGEDLGTVEPWVADVLARRGVLGTSILWFERDENGMIRAPETWRSEVLASVTVHDLPPTAGYLAGAHVALRHDLGLLSRSLEEEARAAEIEREEWADVLVQRGLLESGDSTDEDVTDWVVALHRLVAASPAQLIGIALPDVVGDVRAQNQPGTDQEYPNWRIPLADAEGNPVALEDVVEAELLHRIVDAVRAGGDDAVD